MQTEAALTEGSAPDESTLVTDDTYGLLSVAGMDVALRLSALREVVPCPESFTQLPVLTPGVVGAMDLRGVVVPVLDLRTYLGIDAEAVEGQSVVVLTNGERLLGILADKLHTVMTVNHGDLVDIEINDADLVISHTFIHPSERNIISVLDVEVILGMSGVPTSAEAEADVSTVIQALASTEGAQKYTLVRCGNFTLAIDIAYVHTTLPLTKVSASVLSSELCFGVHPYFGFEVPVIDTLRLSQLGSLQDGEHDTGLVLKFETGYVILALTSLLNIVDVAQSSVMSVPKFALTRQDIFTGIVDVDGFGQCFMVDCEALLLDTELVAHAAMNTVDESATVDDVGAAITLDAASEITDEENATTLGTPQITYSIGPVITTPLIQVDEILPFPESVTGTNTDTALLGMVTHRDAVVPLLCLATLLGYDAPAEDKPRCLLLSSVDGHQVAFVVSELRAIQPLAWEDPSTFDPRPWSRWDLADAVHRSPLVQVGQGTELLPQLDLQKVIAALNPAVPELEVEPAEEYDTTASWTDEISDELSAEADETIWN